MRGARLIGPVLFGAGIATLAVALARQEATLALVLVFPIIQATGPWGALGVLLLVAGFVGTLLMWPFPLVRSHGADVLEEPAVVLPAAAPVPSRRWGGIVFLGPIPIVFGSDPRVTRAMLLIGVALFVALLALTLRLLRVL